MSIIIHKSSLGKVPASIRSVAGRITLASAYHAEKVAKESMSKPKTGITYPAPKGSGRKTHTASAPGEAPAIDTGTLVASIHSEQVNTIDARCFTPIEYAQPLEFGTIKMGARPFMTPAGYSAMKFAREFADKALRGELINWG